MVDTLALGNEPDSKLGQAISHFLWQKHRLLRSYAQSKTAVSRLRAATESRNDAVHGDIAAEDAKQVYAEARSFLDMLVRNDPRVAER